MPPCCFSGLSPVTDTPHLAARRLKRYAVMKSALADVADRVLHRVVLRLDNVGDLCVLTVLTMVHLDLELQKLAGLRGA